MGESSDNKHRRAIQDNDWLYNLLSSLVQYGFRCHYRSFTVRGLENLPTDGTYIIAPCHQQALMEPLAVLTFERKAPVFLARADLFRKPTLRKVLTFLKIMPVYRIRDGQEQLGRNQEIFDRCRDVLLSDSPLCLMAEGRHNNRHHLLNMGKGMFRIAGETQAALGDRPLYIVPTGIDFDEYEQPYSNCVVNIGRPIAVMPFMELYRTNEPLALNQMRDALFQALLPLMHDIRSDEHYDDIITLCHLLTPAALSTHGLTDSAWNRFCMRQEISTRIESGEKDVALLQHAARLRDACRQMGVGEKTLAGHRSPVATLALALAIMAVAVVCMVWQPLRMTTLFALMCYPMGILPTHLLVRRRVADPQFRSSFNWGVRFFGTIVYTLLMAIVVACTGGMWMNDIAHIGAWWSLVFLAAALLLARLSAPVTVLLRTTMHDVHYHLLRITHRQLVLSLEHRLHEMGEVYCR